MLISPLFSFSIMSRAEMYLFFLLKQVVLTADMALWGKNVVEQNNIGVLSAQGQ